MKVETVKFGDLYVDEETVITMPEGLPGFPGFSRFVLIERLDTAPFCWLQSVEQPNLNLVMMNPFFFMPDYNPELETIIQIRKWEGIKSDDLQVFVVVNILEDDGNKRVTANLIGPIVVNKITKEAVQFVFSNSQYSHRHDVIKSLEDIVRESIKNNLST